MDGINDIDQPKGKQKKRIRPAFARSSSSHLQLMITGGEGEAPVM